MKRLLPFLLTALLCLARAQLPAQAHRSEPDSALGARVKTAFLYKLSRYVLWPEKEPGPDFPVAVIGDTPMLPYLKELSREKTPDGRKISLKVIKVPGEIGGCRILFVAGSEADLLPEIFRRAERAGALTVADSPGFAVRGAAVNFVVSGGRVRFEINRAAAERAGLELSSELLKLALLVEDGHAEPRRAAP